MKSFSDSSNYSVNDFVKLGFGIIFIGTLLRPKTFRVCKVIWVVLKIPSQTK